MRSALPATTTEQDHDRGRPRATDGPVASESSRVVEVSLLAFKPSPRLSREAARRPAPSVRIRHLVDCGNDRSFRDQSRDHLQRKRSYQHDSDGNRTGESVAAANVDANDGLHGTG